MAALLGWLANLGSFIGTYIAARWGFKVALLAVVGGVYIAIYAAVMAVLAGLWARFPTGWPAAALSALPDQSAMASAASIYLGTLATLKSIEYWRLWLGVAAKMAAS